MPNWLKDQFNNWFGSNITHLANAYARNDFVWVTFQREKLSMEQVEWSLKALSGSTGSGEVRVELKNKATASFFRLPFNEVHIERRKTNSEFMSVLAGDDLICDNLEIPANRSYVITKKGQVKEQDYGNSNLFRDWTGHNHKPKN